MSNYETKEASFGSSQPVEIYKFYFGDETYCMTSADIDISWQGNTYLKSSIKRGDLEGLSNPESGTLDMTMALPNSLVQQVLTVPPSMPINLIISRAQRSDLSDFRQVWVGRVRAHEVVGQEVHLHGISILHREYRIGNPIRYQKACAYALYDEYNCQVSPETLKITCNPVIVTASKVSSPSLVWTAASIPSGMKEGWFVGGFVTYSDTVSNVNGKRAIIDYDHVNGVITVFPGLRGFTSGASMEFHPGCRHDTYDCHNKFNNLLNYGGDPILPLEDPYDPYVDEF